LLLAACATGSAPRGPAAEWKAPPLRTVRAAEQAVEQEDLERVMQLVAGTYADADGRTRDELRRQLSDFFRRYDGISVRRQPPRLHRAAEGVVVEEDFVTTARSADGGEVLHFQGRSRIHLVLEGGRWKIAGWETEPRL